VEYLNGQLERLTFQHIDGFNYISPEGVYDVLVQNPDGTFTLTKPQGDGPFPAVVLLHGAGGIREYHDVWAERLASWGYVTLQVDSFGPRGLSTAFGDLNMVFKRTYDAYDAKSYLGGIPFVDPKRIGVMGWSQGGATTLTVLDQKRDDSFRSAVAIYPYCNRINGRGHACQRRYHGSLKTGKTCRNREQGIARGLRFRHIFFSEYSWTDCGI